MSALTDLFTAMANKIRSKTGTQTTYTPSEMVSDGIDDVYDAGVASVPQPTSITPSNSSPASMTANTGYKPTANGYAISSYSSVTPSSTQTAVSSGDIVKIGGSGVIVDTVPPTPTSITPSNRAPVALTSNSPVIPTGSGYAIVSYSNLSGTLSNRVSEYLYSGNSFYRTQYAIGSGYFYNNKPTGRVLFSCMLANLRTSTGWEKVSFTAKTVYDEDGTSASVCMDENFAHFDDNGQIVVDRAISTAYLAGYSPRGVTSSGTAVYGGVAFYKNGTLISGASSYGSSSSANPNFRRVQTSFAVGDVISIYTRVSSTTQGYVRCTCSIVTP